MTEARQARFGSGRSVLRVEDDKLLTGKGSFADDVSSPGQMHTCFLRSPHPLNYLKNAWRMWTYGGWLKRQARAGRFHYLSAETVREVTDTCGLTPP